MTDYLAAHKKNFEDDFPIVNTDMKPGAIVTFTYVDRDKKITRPVCIVLNPVWKGNLHAIRIDMIPPVRIQRFVWEITTWYSRLLNAKVRSRVPLLAVNLGNPKSFYQSKLRVLMPSLLRTDDAYREYKLNHIRGLKLIQYRFDVTEKYDIKKQKEDAETARKRREKELMRIAVRNVEKGLTKKG